MTTFPEAAHRELQNSQLRRNIRAATGTIRAKTAAVTAELPDWQDLRAAGSAIKARAMADLEASLLRLEEQVIRAGGEVHWARDAEEARRIIVGLARDAGGGSVVKVKSMTTDEIGLNPALQAAGMDPVETDLADMIVQLSHDTPSHILVPAIHKNRAEIRDLFAAQFDRPDLGDKPEDLAAAARAHLRAKFLDADVAISGANFAIAETGTICVVESEGNGRMCLTLANTLITLMGIEKVLPALAGSGGVPAIAAAGVDRRADEPVHLVVFRRAAGRRAAGVPSRAAGWRADRHPRRRGGARDAALHPLLALPQRLPGLRADRRPRLFVDVSGSDRRHRDAATARP